MLSTSMLSCCLSILFSVGFCALFPFAMGPRAKWETSLDTPGCKLAYLKEICHPLSVEHISVEPFPVQQLHPSASGITFATFASFETVAS